MTNTMTTTDLSQIIEALGHDFADPALLERALTHPSACGRKESVSHSYERLEFLGDRVLGLVIADVLLSHFPKESEGSLAKRFVALVRREALAMVATTIGLEKHIRLAKGEEESGERDNPALQADVCEAVIAALYLDGGYDVARAFVEKYWAPLVRQDVKPPQDAKTALQEWAQARALPLPSYREVGRAGPPHAPTFVIEVSVNGLPAVTGEGTSKRKAQQEAAEALLRHIEQQGSDPQTSQDD